MVTSKQREGSSPFASRSRSSSSLPGSDGAALLLTRSRESRERVTLGYHVCDNTPCVHKTPRLEFNVGKVLPVCSTYSHQSRFHMGLAHPC